MTGGLSAPASASLKLLLLLVFVLISNQGVIERVLDFWGRGHVTGLLDLFGFDPTEIRSVLGPGLLEPIQDEDMVRAFTYGSIAGPPGIEVQWKDMPSDLTTLIEDALTN